MQHFYGNDPNQKPPGIPPDISGTKTTMNSRAALIIAIAVALLIMPGIGLVMLISV
jgi:hypothetical protein